MVGVNADHALEAIHQTFGRLEKRWLPASPDTRRWFGYEPLPTAEFLRQLGEAMELTEGRRFLDLGCGIGRNLAIAHQLGCSVVGVDRYQPYLAVASDLVPEARLVHANILELDKTDLAADIVHMYRPAVDEELELELERHVEDRLASGTVLLLPTRRRARVI